MFLNSTKLVAYRDPWAKSLKERLAGVGSGRKNVAYLYETPDSSTFRYRVYNMMQALHVSDHDTWATFFSYREIDVLTELLHKFDTLVICRCRYDHKLSQLICAAKCKSIEVIYDVDDLVFEPDLTHLIVDTLDEKIDQPHIWDHWFAYTSRIGAALKICDRAITTNKYLADQLEAATGIPSSIVPNFMNSEQLETSRQHYTHKKKTGFERNGEFTIGYFSGSPSHNKDFRIVEVALVELMQRHSDIRVLIVGYLDDSSILAKFKDRVSRYPLQDFINLQRLISLVEINVVPLQNNIFTNCKSNLKYFEASVTGTLTIASPTFTYANSIIDGKNGFLANSTQWVEAIENVKSLGKEYAKIAKQSHDDVIGEYTPVKQAPALIEALFGNQI